MRYIKVFYQAVKKIILWTLVCMGAVTVFFEVYYLSKLYRKTNIFDLKTIVVKNNNTLSPGEIIELTKLKRGVRIMDIDIKQAIKRMNDSPYIETSKIRIVYPATIVIEVGESIPVAFVNIKNELRYVNRNGDILNRVKPENSYDLPIITSAVDKDIIGFINLSLKISPFIYHQISEIEKTKSGIELFLTHSSSNVVVGNGDFEKKIVVLENFLKEEYGNISFKDVDYIDLRFNRCVILKEFAVAEK